MAYHSPTPAGLISRTPWLTTGRSWGRTPTPWADQRRSVCQRRQTARGGPGGQHNVSKFDGGGPRHDSGWSTLSFRRDGSSAALGRREGGLGSVLCIPGLPTVYFGLPERQNQGVWRRSMRSCSPLTHRHRPGRSGTSTSYPPLRCHMAAWIVPPCHQRLVGRVALRSCHSGKRRDSPDFMLPHGIRAIIPYSFSVSIIQLKLDLLFLSRRAGEPAHREQSYIYIDG